jgi:hypothetical protein
MVCGRSQITLEKSHKKVWYTSKIINTLCSKSFTKECRSMQQYVRHMCFSFSSDTLVRIGIIDVHVFISCIQGIH